jgi:bile acid:Na+ symporter, BASS family
LERVTLLFLLWILLAAVLALPCPWLSTWLQGPLIVLALGVTAQHLVMPALSVFVAWVLRLPPPLAVGLILVG